MNLLSLSYLFTQEQNPTGTYIFNQIRAVDSLYFFIWIRNTALISSVFAYRYSRTKPYICSQIRAVDSFYLIKSPNHSVLLGSNMYR